MAYIMPPILLLCKHKYRYNYIKRPEVCKGDASVLVAAFLLLNIVLFAFFNLPQFVVGILSTHLQGCICQEYLRRLYNVLVLTSKI